MPCTGPDGQQSRMQVMHCSQVISHLDESDPDAGTLSTIWRSEIIRSYGAAQRSGDDHPASVNLGFTYLLIVVEVLQR